MSASPASDAELEEMKAKTQHYKTEIEKTKGENEQNEQKLKQLKEVGAVSIDSYITG